MNNEETKNTKNSNLWKKIPLKIRLIIIGIAAGFFFIVIFLVVLVAPLMELGIINIDRYSAYAMGNPYYANSNSYWWPIGSTETTTENGILFAKGDPENTVVTSEYGDTEDRGHSHNGLDIANYTGNNVTNIIA